MDSRTRVRLAIDHKEPDRVPFDFGGTLFTTIHIESYKKLRNYLDLPDRKASLMEILQQVAVVDEDLAERLHTDCRGLHANQPSGYNHIIREDGDYLALTDEWRIGHRMPKVKGHYYDMYFHPMANADSVDDIRKFQWPDPSDPARFSGLKARCESLREKGKFVLLDSFGPGVTEMHAWLRGFEDYYSDLAINHTLAEFIMDKILELKMIYWKNVLDQVGDCVDAVVESDDLGGQERLLMSPETYRKLIKPRHTALFSFIKKLAPVKVFLHSCGAIKPLIGDLIESGIDILNPIQKGATDMNLLDLKRNFGKDLVFWGGGIDTQFVLGTSSTDQIKDEVKRTIETLAPGGGFVFTTVHNIQPNVPPKNIVAMWEALQEYGTY